jgi:putative flippase GtrA
MKAAAAPMEDTLQAATNRAEFGWQSLIFGPTRNIASQFARYVVVGSIAFVVDFLTLYALTDWLYVYYLTSAAIAFIVGLTCNYMLSRVWVFDRRTMQNTCFEFTVFAAIGLIGLGLTEAAMWFLIEILHVYYLLAKIGTAALVFLWNFSARRYALFR